jgi:predicted GIY-YIG superfamily endonuclease
MLGGWTYILTNKPNGILYVGVTSDLARRMWEHREGLADGFTKRHRLKRLVTWNDMMRLSARSNGRKTSSTGLGLGRLI